MNPKQTQMLVKLCCLALPDINTAAARLQVHDTFFHAFTCLPVKVTSETGMDNCNVSAKGRWRVAHYDVSGVTASL